MDGTSVKDELEGAERASFQPFPGAFQGPWLKVLFHEVEQVQMLVQCRGVCQVVDFGAGSDRLGRFL